MNYSTEQKELINLLSVCFNLVENILDKESKTLKHEYKNAANGIKKHLSVFNRKAETILTSETIDLFDYDTDRLKELIKINSKLSLDRLFELIKKDNKASSLSLDDEFLNHINNFFKNE